MRVLLATLLAISVAGAGDIRGILQNMASGSAAYYMVYMAYAIQVRSPDFKPADMLVGAALERYPAVTTRGCWSYAYASFLHDRGAKVVKEGWDRTAAAQRFFQDGEVGVAAVGGPLLDIAGEADETVPLAHLRATARKACDHGIKLAFRSYPGLDHDPVMDKSTPDQLAWIRDRFSGQPFQTSCAALTP